MADKIKTSDELVEEELNKELAKDIVKRKKDIRRKQAEIKQLEKEIQKIKDGELVPDGESCSSSNSNKLSNVAFLLDESGSMSSCKSETIEGFNEYVKKLRKDAPHLKMTLTKFDSSKVDTVYNEKSVRDVPLLNDESYQPGAATPLLDAIGVTIDKMKKLKRVLFIIQTDGQENASREYSNDSIKKKIKNFTDKGWEFVYLGADQDAYLNAKNYGLSRGQTYSYDSMDSTMAMGLQCAAFTLGVDSGEETATSFNYCMTESSGENITPLNKEKKKKKR